MNDCLCNNSSNKDTDYFKVAFEELVILQDYRTTVFVFVNVLPNTTRFFLTPYYLRGLHLTSKIVWH